ncbi:MAG: DUF3685 domain-containing protein [Stigonema ocellatum SAG 48.90 = DSM 106950]|nr:DUF3685 domain-containing protein [Stigonema ocellatum SAG 48.90 = DSM 106950]
MSDRPIKLLLVDQDPIFRLGLRVALEEFPNLQVVWSAETYTAALQILAEAQQDPTSVNLVILELGSAHSTSSQQLGLQLCQQLKTQYPNLGILLLSSVQEQGLLLAAKAAGVHGYCPKGTPISELVTAMEEVVAGRSYWFGEVGETGGQRRGGAEERRSGGAEERRRERMSPAPLPPCPPAPLPPNPPVSKSSQLRNSSQNNLRLSGISYINASLAQVKAKLQVPGLPVLERAILAGKQRELLTARWLLNRLLASPNQKRQEVETGNFTSLHLPPPTNSSLSSVIPNSDPKTQNSSSLLSSGALQAGLFASCINKLQFNLKNVTDIPLEIDILRIDKKRELLYIILKKLAIILEEVENSQIKIEQLYTFKKSILFDVWIAATTEFFGKFSRLKVGDSQLEIVTFLRQEAEVVQTEILNRIPLTNELLSYLLFQTDLRVDNTLYLVGSVEAKEQGLMLLENLLIQVANGVVQPLLNRLADVEEIKQSFYNRQMISTREIERFRNNLSWKYRIKNYITEPMAIFESRYELFVFAPRGIATVSIYAPRGEELAQLSGIPLMVTLMLEFRDAIAPPLQSLLSFLGNGFIFILTQVIGRGLGLIARGILQGIGWNKI